MAHERLGRSGQKSAVLAAAFVALAVGCGGKHREEGDANAGRGGESVGQGGERTGQGGDNVGGERGGTSSAGGRGGTSSAGGRGGTSSSGGANRGGIGGEGGKPEGGSSSTGGTTVIEPPHPSAQLDVLFVVDNSIAMADKQSVLSDSVPTLTHRFLHPRCLDATGAANGQEGNEKGLCASGTPEFPAVTDMHVGVISTSLGSHGGSGACTAPSADDHAQLLPLVRTDPLYPVETWNKSGFLSWNEDPSLGGAVEAELNTNLRNLILSAGQAGCGFEAPLEAMYRFLIDPNPPTSVPVVTDPSKATAAVRGDAASNPVLQQRSAFLRPKSTLAIVILTDENDCSIVDAGQAWLTGTTTLGGMSFRMPRATSQCEANPNDPCCHSCAAAGPSGCPSPSGDPSCAQGNTLVQDDNFNLRCFEQQRRFGFDFLHPTSRYVAGLSQSLVVDDADGTYVQNPLFPPGGRTPSMVFLTGILGVPWQDLAAEPTLPDALDYLSPTELQREGRWDIVLGQPGSGTNPPTTPGDKLMFETFRDRSTLFGNAPHPLLGAAAALAPSTATGRPNVINGHESNIADQSFLQNACIMPLPQARLTCSGPGCECLTTDTMGNPTPNSYDNATCNGTTQTHTVAHPSIRQLRVIRELAALTGNASPASVCWKSLDGAVDSPGRGYNPALELLLHTMTPQLNRR